MGSFSIPLSGLDADSTALNTIANNLANLNTTGFKSQTANFSDLFYQQVGTAGSGDPIEVGAGTQVTSTETDSRTAARPRPATPVTWHCRGRASLCWKTAGWSSTPATGPSMSPATALWSRRRD